MKIERTTGSTNLSFIQFTFVICPRGSRNNVSASFSA